LQHGTFSFPADFLRLTPNPQLSEFNSFLPVCFLEVPLPRLALLTHQRQVIRTCALFLEVFHLGECLMGRVTWFFHSTDFFSGAKQHDCTIVKALNKVIDLCSTKRMTYFARAIAAFLVM
jgi:hypothetical protein